MAAKHATATEEGVPPWKCMSEKFSILEPELRYPGTPDPHGIGLQTTTTLPFARLRSLHCSTTVPAKNLTKN